MRKKAISIVAGLLLATSLAQAADPGNRGGWGDGTPNNNVVVLPGWYAMILDWFDLD